MILERDNFIRSMRSEIYRKEYRNDTERIDLQTQLIQRDKVIKDLEVRIQRERERERLWVILFLILLVLSLSLSLSLSLCHFSGGSDICQGKYGAERERGC